MKQLRSWKPRGPSARLERAIFGPAMASAIAGSAPSPEADVLPFGTGTVARWLGPATAALLAIGAVFHQVAGQSFSGAASTGPLVALVLSNHQAAAWLPGSFSGEANNVPRETFEWTNGNSSTSSMGSISPSSGIKQ